MSFNHLKHLYKYNSSLVDRKITIIWGGVVRGIFIHGIFILVFAAGSLYLLQSMAERTAVS